MTRTAPATPFRRSLALSTALGMTLGALATPARAQNTPSTPDPQGVANGVTFSQGAGVGTLYTNVNQVNGSAAILNVNLIQAKSIINWKSFDVSSGSEVNFRVIPTANLPVASTNFAVLNRVTTKDASEIFGKITGPENLAVWLINPNGILFGSNTNINVGSLVLSTLDTTDLDFNTPGAVKLVDPTGSKNTISSSAGNLPGSITTTSGVLALISKGLDLQNLNVKTNSGANPTAFVMASDVDIDTTPGSPLSIRVNAGTVVDRQTIKGTIIADGTYVLLTPADGVNALLNMTAATINNATVNPVGVVVLGTAVTANPNRANLVNAVNSTGSTGIDLGTVDLKRPTPGGTPGAIGDLVVLGRANATNGGDITVANVNVGNRFLLQTNVGGTPTRGTVSATGNINAASVNLIGAAVSLGNGLATVTDTATGDVVLNALAGNVTIGGGVSLTGNTFNSTNATFQIGGAGTTGLALGGSDLRAGENGKGTILFGTATSADRFDIGNVTAGRISGQIGMAPASVGVITRTETIKADSLVLSGENSIGTSSTLNVGTGGSTAIATGGNLTLRGSAGVYVTGAITNLGTSTAGVVVSGGNISVLNSTMAGKLTLAAGLSGATFTTLAGTGDKTVTSGGGITGGSITGPGDVQLVAATGNAIAISGALGMQNAKLTSLKIDGGRVTADSVAVVGATTIGQTRRVDSLDIGGTVDTGSLAVSTTGASTFGTVLARIGAVNVGSSGGAVTFNGTVDGPKALTVSVGGTGNGVTFRDKVGSATPFETFTASGTTAVRLNGGSLTTTGAQNYGGLLVLGKDTTLTGTGAIFNGIDGAGGAADHNLTLNFSGVQALSGLTGVRNLVTDAAGGTTIGGVISTSGSQSYGDAVTLTGATTLRSAGAATGVGAHDITFGGTLNGANALTVATPGILTFIGAVGATPLQSIEATGVGGVSIRAPSITTTDFQRYGATVLDGAGDVTLNAGGGAVDFQGLNGPRGLTVNTRGLTTLAGAGGVTPLASITTDAPGIVVLNGAIRTDGTQSYGDTVALYGNTTLTGGLAVFGGTVMGNGYDLTINTSGAQRLGNNITGVGNLTTDATGAAGTTTLTGPITTAGNQTYGDLNVVVAGNLTLQAGTERSITFAGKLDGDIDGRNLVLTAGRTQFGGDVGTTPGGRFATLTVNGVTNVTGPTARTIATLGGQTYNGAIALGGDLTLIGAGATFGGGVIGNAAAPRGLTLTFSDASTLPASAFSDLGSLVVNGASVTTVNGDVATIGAQTYLSDLVLGGPVTLTSSANGAITLNKASGKQALVVNTGGVTTFNNVLAGLTSITTDAPGSTVLNVGIDTSGAQTYRDNVVLGADVVLRSTGGDTVGFGGTVTGAHALTVQTTGLTMFGGAVGQMGGNGAPTAASPTGLNVFGGGAVLINGGAITTAGAQGYSGQVRLGADTVLTGTAGVFGGGVAGNGHDLSLNFSGPTAIGGGLFSGVRNFASGGGGTTSLSGTIETSGGQSYADDVVLTDATTLLSAGGTGTGTIAFGGALDGKQALTVATGGRTVFGGAVGVNDPLSSITVDGAGGASFSGGSVISTGVQSYKGPSTLGGNTTLRTEGADIQFGQTVDGPYSLSVRTGAGAITSGNVVFGGAAALTGLAIRANAATIASGRVGTLAAAINTGGLSYRDGAGLNVGTVDGLTGINVGADAVDLRAGGLLSLQAAVNAGAVSLAGSGIAQAAGATVDAGAGTLLLDGQGRAIGLAGILTTTNAGADAIRVVNASDVQLGTVRTGAGGTLTLGLPGAGALTGAVTQVAGGTITVGTLTGVIGGTATLTGANSIDTLGAFSANGWSLRTVRDLSVAGPADAGSGNLSLAVDGGLLSLGGDLLAGTGTVSLSGRAITQGSGGIRARALTATATESLSLTSATNAIGTLGNLTSGGALVMRNSLAVTLQGDLTSGGTLELTAPGIAFAGRTLTAPGAVTLNGLAGDVAGGTVTGSDVTVSGGGVDIGTAKATTGALAITTTDATRALTLGTGTAVTTATLNGAGALSVGASLSAIGSVTTTSGGATGIASVTSTGGNISVTGASVSVANAAAKGGLLLRGTAGAVSLGTGTAGVTATLDATSTLDIQSSLTSAGTAALTALGVATVNAVESTNGGISVKAGSLAMTRAAAFTTLNLRTTSGALSLDTGTAGAIATLDAAGALGIDTSLTSAGDAALTATGMASLSSVESTKGGVSVKAANIAATRVAARTTLDLMTPGALSLGIGTAGGVASLQSGGTLDVTDSLTSAGGTSLYATGSATLKSVESTGGSAVINAASIAATRVAARTMLDLRTRTGALSLGTGTTGGTAALNAAGTLDIDTSLTSAGSAALTATGMATLNSVESTGGGVSVKAGSLSATRVIARTGLDLRTTGALSLGTGTAGGTATLEAGGTLDIGTSLTSAGSAALTALGIATVTSVESTGGGVAVTAASLSAPRAVARTTLDLRTTSGDLALGSGIAGGVATLTAMGGVTLNDLGTLATPIGGALFISAGGGVTGGTAVASGPATVTAGGPVKLTLLNGATVAATGRSIDIGESNATGALTLRATGGTLTLGIGAAGGAADLSATGDLSVLTRLTAGNGATITTGGNAQLARVVATAGDVSVTAAGTVGGVNGGRADLSATGPGGLVKIAAGQGVVLGPVQGDALSLTAPAIDLASATGSSLTLNATQGSLTLGTATIGGAVSLTAKTALTVTAVNAGGAITATAGGLATVGSATGTSVSITGGSANVGTAMAATGALLIRTTGGNLTLGTGKAAGGATLDAQGGTLAITDALTAAGDVMLNATGATTGKAVTSTGGAVTVGGASVDLTTVSAKTALGVSATAGDVTLPTATAGGDATIKSSGGVLLGTFTGGGNATVVAGGDLSVTTLQTARMASLTANNALKLGAVTGGGIVGAGKTVEVATATSGSTLALNATGGALSLGKGIATGAATLGATGPLVIATSLTSGGNAAVTAGGAATVAAIGGADVSVSGGTVNVASATARAALTLTSTGGALSLGTGVAGTTATVNAAGPLAVTTALTSGGNALVAATGAATLASIGSTGGDVTVSGVTVDVTAATAKGTLGLTANGGGLALGTGTAGGAATLKATGPVAVTTSLTSGGTATVSTTGAATLADIRSTAGDVNVSGAAVNVTGATANGVLALTSTGGALSLGTGTAGGAAMMNAAGPLSITTSLTSGGTASVSTTGAATVTSIGSKGGDVNVSGAAVNVLGATANGSLALTSTGGALSLGTGAAGGLAAMNAAGPLSITTSLTSGGTASVSTTGAATVTSIGSTGGDVNVSGAAVNVVGATANRALALTSSNGALVLGTGMAGTTATLGAAGPLTIATSLISAGRATVTSTGVTTVANIGSTGGDLGVSGASVAVAGATAKGALALNSTGGALSLGTGAAGTTATLGAVGPLSITTSLTGAGDVRTTASGVTTIAAITSTGGAVAVTGAGVSVTNAKAASTLDLTATAGDLSLGTGTVGGAAMLRSSGALGSTGLTTGGAATLTAGTTLTSGALNATGAATLTAAGAANLGATSSGAAVAITGGTITAGQTVAATGLTLTSAGNLTLAGGQAGGDALFDANGLATLGAVTAGGAGGITVKANDAAIGGTLRAGTVAFSNRAAATTALKLGNGLGAGGFMLDAAEVNNVEAGQLTLDGGAGEVQIGALAFDADAGRTRVDVLSTGRIDVTGAASGAGAGRMFRFGGTAANTGDKASVIRVVSTPEAGGRLLFETADVDLRGSRIGVGQSSGFLNPIGFGDATGQAPAAVVGGYVANPNSSLYNAAFGGTPYPVGSTLLVANSLTVRYTDYALFQNTGEPGKTAGITLGTAAAGPQRGALAIQGPSGNGNGFAFFGTIGGLGGDAASVLGPSVVVVNGSDIANTRINGCVVGSAAGCLSAVVTQPLLSVFDSSRTVVFRAGDDLVVPFDPVVGTNNESLFAGLGLMDETAAQTSCSVDPNAPGCGPVQEGGK